MITSGDSYFGCRYCIEKVYRFLQWECTFIDIAVENIQETTHRRGIFPKLGENVILDVAQGLLFMFGADTNVYR